MKRTENILVAWIGGKDINNGLKDKAGPVLSTLQFSIPPSSKENQYQHAYLLYNYSAKELDAKSYVHWLEGQTQASIHAQYIPLTSPQDLGEIYLAADQLLSSIKKDHPEAAITLQITPGTPAMQAVWILLGKTKYPNVTFLQSSAEQGVHKANIPFDISAEFLPSSNTAKAGLHRTDQQLTDQKLKSLAQVRVPTHAAFDDIITSNTHMNTLKQRASVLAQHDVPVLINGASGTGKELFATAIHNASSRKDKQFQVVNCGAIPPELIDSTLFGHKKGAFTGAASDQQGVFEAASGGTLFLDEFGELPLNAQVRLLRVLQEGTLSRVGDSKVISVDVRIICATNKDLMKAIAESKFREDLFYRVAVGVINLPAIKDRKGDLSLLAKTLLKQINEQMGFTSTKEDKKLSPKANNLILQHSWPGNVRELYSTLLRAGLWSQKESISEQDLKEALFIQQDKSSDVLAHDLSEALDLEGLLSKVEEHYVRLAWDKSSGKKKKAAELLGINSYQNYSNKLEKYKVK
jgi:transcriptional regulator with PAS, ATPase and Fis domain